VKIYHPASMLLAVALAAIPLSDAITQTQNLPLPLKFATETTRLTWALFDTPLKAVLDDNKPPSLGAISIELMPRGEFFDNDPSKISYFVRISFSQQNRPTSTIQLQRSAVDDAIAAINYIISATKNPTKFRTAEINFTTGRFTHDTLAIKAEASAEGSRNVLLEAGSWRTPIGGKDLEKFSEALAEAAKKLDELARR
jgi:hypothetical protein